jgi:hypothetical protein
VDHLTSFTLVIVYELLKRESFMSIRNRIAAVLYRAYRSPRLATYNVVAFVYFLREEFRSHKISLLGPSQSVQLIEVDQSIPPLAWVGTLNKRKWTFTVGSGVDVRGNGVFEGVWDAEFDDFHPERSRYVFGSGSTWYGRRPRFVPPKHPQESLFLFFDRRKETSYVSNSLAFLLCEAGLETDHYFAALILGNLREHAYEAAKRGVDRTRTQVASDDRFRLDLCTYFNFSIDQRGRLHRRWFGATREFRTFAEYRVLLERVVTRLFKNSTNNGRQLILDPIVGVSQGYDSAATASITSAIGCTRALTIKANVDGMDDDGSVIGAALGLSVIARPHILGASIFDLRSVAARTMMPQAAEFFATIGIGDEVAFLPFEPDLKESIFFTGIWGDSIWDRAADVTSGFPARIWFNKSFGEFRLRAGFAHVPLPFVGGRHAPTVKALSNHPSMDPYSVGGDYDRPIPRRIAEESGVARHLFGNQKNAQNPLLQGHEEVYAESIAIVMDRYRRPKANSHR